MENNKEKTTNFNVGTRGTDFKGRLKRTKKVQKVVAKKQQQDPFALFTPNYIVLNLTDNGLTSLSALKNSVVVKPEEQLITTTKKAIIVTKDSLTKAKQNLDADTKVLDIGVSINTLIKKILEKNRQKLSELQEKLNKLNKSVPYLYKQEQINEKKEEIAKIKKQAGTIKAECLFISEISDFEDVGVLKSEKLSEDAALFTKISTNQDISDLSESCKNELDYVDELLTILEKTNYLDYQIIKKDSQIGIRDNKFKEYKGEVSDVSEARESLVNEIHNEVSKSDALVEKIEEFDGEKLMLSIPQLRLLSDDYKGFILRSDLLLKLFDLVVHLFKDDQKSIMKQAKTRQQLIKNIYENYETDLNRGIKQLKSLSSSLEKCAYQLSWLKTKFYDNFFKYKDLIPEYDEIYSKLDSLEQKINKDYKTVNSQKKKLKKEKEKVKSLAG